MTEYSITGAEHVFEAIEIYYLNHKDNINIKEVINKGNNGAYIAFQIIIEYDVPETLYKLGLAVGKQKERGNSFVFGKKVENWKKYVKP